MKLAGQTCSKGPCSECLAFSDSSARRGSSCAAGGTCPAGKPDQSNSLNACCVLEPILPVCYLFQARLQPVQGERLPVTAILKSWLRFINPEWGTDRIIFTIITVWGKAIKKYLLFASLFIAWQMVSREDQWMATHQYKVINMSDHMLCIKPCKHFLLMYVCLFLN